MTNIYIREYEDHDILEMTKLITELGYPSSEEDLVIRMSRLRSFLNYKTFVCVCEEKVIGMIGSIQCYAWEHNDAFVRIQALVVSKSFRGLGFGTVLLDKAESWAQSIHASFLVLNCGIRDEREIAHNFYQTRGFEKKSIGYRKYINLS